MLRFDGALAPEVSECSARSYKKPPVSISSVGRPVETRMIETMSHLLAVQSLTVELRTAAGALKPVNEVSLRIEPGQSLGVVGESGSGKTMLSMALMGLLEPVWRLPLVPPSSQNLAKIRGVLESVGLIEPSYVETTR